MTYSYAPKGFLLQTLRDPAHEPAGVEVIVPPEPLMCDGTL